MKTFIPAHKLIFWITVPDLSAEVQQNTSRGQEPEPEVLRLSTAGVWKDTETLYSFSVISIWRNKNVFFKSNKDILSVISFNLWLGTKLNKYSWYLPINTKDTYPWHQFENYWLKITAESPMSYATAYMRRPNCLLLSLLPATYLMAFSRKEGWDFLLGSFRLTTELTSQT